MLGQRFDCISHAPVYLSRMLTLRESEFPGHADYVKEFRTCVIKSKVNTSDLQMGHLDNSRFVEGLSNDAVRRQYIVEVRSKWRSGRPFSFDTLVDTIAEAYMVAGYQLEEVQNASRTTTQTAGAAVSRPLPIEAVPRTRSPWPGGPEAHGPEAWKPLHPYRRRQHHPSAGYPFSLIRGIRNRSPNH